MYRKGDLNRVSLCDAAWSGMGGDTVVEIDAPIRVGSFVVG